jgi:cysteine desulfurase
MRSVYLDFAATTPVSLEVKKAMEPYFSTFFGNPSEMHMWGAKASGAIDNARGQISKALNCQKTEIIFTSSATESINLAHKGLIEAIFINNSGSQKVPNIITSSVEHKAILETCKHLEQSGRATVTYLPVNKYGMVLLSDVKKAISPQTILISLMFVNNEVGTIQPIAEIGSLIKTINDLRSKIHESKIYFHTDATQAIPYLDCDINKLGVDLLSFTGHKLYGPKGIGALFIKSGTPILRQLDGGSQENNLRAGTENVPYIVGLGKAAELVGKNKSKENLRLKKLQTYLISQISLIPQTTLTGHPKFRAPHIASFIIEGVEGEAMLLLLSDMKVAVSTGSACTSRNLAPSHVLTAMGILPEDSHGSLRISLGKNTTQDDIDYAVFCIKKVVSKLRKMAP